MTPKEIKAYEEGEKAFDIGKTKLANPYHTDVSVDKRLYELWENGWISRKNLGSGSTLEK